MKPVDPLVNAAQLLLYPQKTPQFITDSIGRLIQNPLMVNKQSVIPDDKSPKYKAVEDPWNKVYYSEVALNPKDIPEGYTNKVQSQIFASFQAHPDGWNKYFEGSYKNPREAEGNAMATQGTSLVNPQLAIPTQAKTLKTVGTGLSASPSINPFGTLDSGLNI